MKKFTLILIFLLGILLQVFAQKDSVRNVVQNRQLYFSDSVNMATYNFSKLSPLFMQLLMPEQTSSISLGHQLEKGKFIAAQASSKTNTAFLSSEGVTELKGIKLFGSFKYRKVFEDSTRFAHQTRNNTTTSYYYGSPAYNHYERSIYNFKVLGAKDILSNKITLGLGMDYNIADHFSNNDPRGSINEYQLNFNGVASYNISKNIKLGLGYTLGYGQEKVTIGYKNRAYYESLVYPEYVNYVINGYGEPNPKNSDRNYNNLQNRNGLDLIFAATNTTIGSLYLKASQIDERQTYDIRNADGIFDLANYDLNKKLINLLWIKSFIKASLSANLGYENMNGEDFNLSYYATNYLFTSHKINLDLNFSTINNNVTYNYLIGIKQYDEERLDGITGNQVYFKNLDANVGFGFNYKLKNNKSFGASIGGSYSLNLDDNFFISAANESYFTRYVIFHDYLYNTSNSFGGNFSTNYSFTFFNAMQAAVRINVAYNSNIAMKSLQRTLITTPGKDRFFSNISLNLYF